MGAVPDELAEALALAAASAVRADPGAFLALASHAHELRRQAIADARGQGDPAACREAAGQVAEAAWALASAVPAGLLAQAGAAVTGTGVNAGQLELFMTMLRQGRLPGDAPAHTLS